MKLENRGSPTIAPSRKQTSCVVLLGTVTLPAKQRRSSSTHNLRRFQAELTEA
jgi:hypothetical protein